MNNTWISGTVLWFDVRDGHGVLVDSNGNEYYTDSSVAPNNLKAGEAVTFKKNEAIKNTLCAIKVVRDADMVELVRGYNEAQ